MDAGVGVVVPVVVEVVVAVVGGGCGGGGDDGVRGAGLTGRRLSDAFSGSRADDDGAASAEAPAAVVADLCVAGASGVTGVRLTSLCMARPCRHSPHK